MDKSIIAVVIGIIVSFVTSAIIGFILGVLILPGRGMGGLLSPEFVEIVLIGSAIGSLFGGWATAKRAPSSPLTHALVLGLVNGFLSMGSENSYEVRVLQFLVAVAISLLGGWIGSVGHKSKARSPEKPA
jgi:hypothetical protein